MMGGQEAGEKSIEDKEELARQAKQKFLENLHKFQCKARESKAPFQRAYRGPTEQLPHHFRRSCRTSSNRPPKESNHRRSLRSRSNRHRIADNTVVNAEPDIAEPPIYHKERDLNKRLPKTRTLEEKKEDSCNNAADEKIHSPVTSGPIVKSPKNPPNYWTSLAQQAEKKNSKDIRKVSPLSPIRPESAVAKTTDPDFKSSAEDGNEELLKKSKAECVDVSGEWVNVTFMDNTPLKAVIDFLSADLSLSNPTQLNPKKEEVGSMKQRDCAVEMEREADRNILGVRDQDNHQEIEVDSDLSTFEQGKGGVELKDKIQTPDPSAEEDLTILQPSQTILPESRRNSDENSRHSINSYTQNKESQSSAKTLNCREAVPSEVKLPETLLGDSKRNHPATNEVSSLFKTNLKPFTSLDKRFNKEFSGSSVTGAEFDTEEAIAQFKKLSEEIDEIRNIGFRKSIAVSPPRKPIPPPPETAPRSKSISMHPALQQTVKSPTSAIDPFVSKKQYEENDVDTLQVTGKTSHSVVAREKRRERNLKSREPKEHVKNGARNTVTEHFSNQVTNNNKHRSDASSADRPHIAGHDSIKVLPSCDTGNDSKISTKPIKSPEPVLTAHAASKAKERRTMSAAVETSGARSKTGSAVNFRKLSQVERRKKLREVVLRHRSESAADSESSSLPSDDSSVSSDIDMEWLDNEDSDSPSAFATTGAGKRSDKQDTNFPLKTSLEHPGRAELSEEKISNGDRSSSPLASVGNMKALWETKNLTNPATKMGRSSFAPELEGIATKVDDVKAAWPSAVSHQTSTPLVQKRRLSYEKENEGAGGEVMDGSEPEPPKVGSMLSMWENKWEKKEAKATEDEAPKKRPVGKLKVAKNIFENLTKRKTIEANNRDKADERPKSPVLPSTNINVVKSLFENKMPFLAPQRGNSPLRFCKQSSSSTNSSASSTTDHSQHTTSGVHGSGEGGINTKTGGSLDFTNILSTESLIAGGDADPETNALLKSSQHAVQRRTKGRANKGRAMKVEESRNLEEISSPTRSRDHDRSSNIQAKISARKKKHRRRPMTQPVTNDDVSSAKQLMHDQQRPKQRSSEEEHLSPEEEEDKEPSFSERLSFFNQLIVKSAFEPNKDSRKRQRNSLKRYRTQPVDRDEVEQARQIHCNHQLLQLSSCRSEQFLSEQSAGDSSKSNLTKESSANREISQDFNSNGEYLKKSVSESDVPDRPKKVGKLASELRTKFAEINSINNNNIYSRSVSPSSRSTGTSESSQSLPPPRRIHLRHPEPDPTPNSAQQEDKEETASEDSDMGRSRETDIKSTGSIHDRLKLLEKNKEEGWRKRLEDKNKTTKSSLEERMSKLQGSEEKWKKNKPSDSSSVRSPSASGKAKISDRLNSIIANSESWKTKKGKQNDATQFTTEAKIAKRDGHKVATISTPPLVTRRAQAVTVSEEPVVTIKDVNSNAPSLNKLTEVLKLSQKGLEPEVIKTTEESTTEIPEMVDENFDKFFNVTTHIDEAVDEATHAALTNGDANSELDEMEAPSWLDDDSGDHALVHNRLSDIGRLKANVQRPTARTRTSHRNPIKALASRTDVKQSYTEHRSNISKLEQQRIASVHGHAARFTSAALAGLAYKADLSKVNLRSTKKTQAFSASDHKPWKDKMLLRVKGRRHVQTRLVEPVCDSLNSGDAYLLILPNQLFAWFGDFSNVIEKAKVQEIADYIIHKGDLGSKASSLNIIKEEQSSSFRSKEFWKHIGGKTEIEPSGGAEEDELYEVNAEATIKSYKLDEAKLLPYKDSWGKLPTMGQLSTSSTYVFDFGAEMYIWHGKEVSFEDRQLAIKLARALWDQGYDYTELGFCPFAPSSQATSQLKGPRPDWGLFARVNENLETALVQEKFEDWSNIAREIGDKEEVMKETSRGQIACEMKIKTTITPDMTSCDVEEMHMSKAQPLPIHIEGYNLWKGHGLLYDEDGRGLEVVTHSVDVWHASDKEITLLKDEHKGIFCRAETYVVRWRYAISSTGKWKANTATSGDLKKDPKGRERVAYFLWSGCDSSVTEKGASALMATELDKEAGSQINVLEGREPPVFCQCFNGSMIVIDGKKGSREGYYSWRLFEVRGSDEKEVVLHQVPCHVSSLRSRSSFVALQGRQGKLLVWHGAKSPDLCREMAQHAASLIQEEKRTCLGFRATCKSVSLAKCDEENESNDFIEAVGRMRRNKYLSLSSAKPHSMTHPRVWHLTQGKDQFVANELPPVAATTNDENFSANCFPIIQQQLKDLNKPAIVLLESAEGLFLWQSTTDEELTGSAKRQYDISRRLALETTIEYNKKFRKNCTALLVHEYHEPIEFTNAFPSWKEPEMKISFEEKRSKKPQPVEDVVKSISRLTYTLEELRSNPLPEGVDPNHLETYLTVSDFVDLFEMSKQEFYDLPPWKQQNLRKEKNLF